MPFLLKYPDYDIYIGDIVFDKKGRCRCYCSNAPKKDAHRFRTAKAAEKFRKDNGLTDREVVYIKPVPKNRPFTYKVLMEEAEEMYKRIAVHSNILAPFETRDFIAKNVDRCVDVERNKKALAVREWDEYKKYAPMKKSEYRNRLKALKAQFDASLAELKREYNTRGKSNKNFHKI